MDVNILTFSWTVLILGFSTLNFSIGLRIDTFPSVLHELITYGKQRRSLKSKWEWLSVQKRWFTVFYLWGLLWNVTILCYFICYIKGLNNIGMTILQTTAFRILFYPNDLNLPRSSCCCSFVHLQVLLSLVFMCVQTGRRLIECLTVTIFCPNSRMHLAHAIFGMFFYTVIGPGILKQLDKDTHDCQSIPLIGVFQMMLSVVLFCWSSWHQFKCHFILAGIRKSTNKRTTITDTPNSSSLHNQQYSIPHGDWFQYCSSPHYWAEILIYISIWLALGLSNTYFLMCLATTVLNLVYTARLNHSWYIRTFEYFPKNRRIIIPFIY